MSRGWTTLDVFSVLWRSYTQICMCWTILASARQTLWLWWTVLFGLVGWDLLELCWETLCLCSLEILVYNLFCCFCFILIWGWYQHSAALVKCFWENYLCFWFLDWFEKSWFYFFLAGWRGSQATDHRERSSREPQMQKSSALGPHGADWGTRQW